MIEIFKSQLSLKSKIAKELLLQNLLIQPARVSLFSLLLASISCICAGFYYRPEYNDGARFVFQILNFGSGSFSYINRRTLSEIIFAPFVILKYLPSDDPAFWWERIAVNLWYAWVPVLIFALPIFVLHRQKREHLLPYLYMVLFLFVLFAAGFHGSLISETVGLGLAFWWLYPKESYRINLLFYSCLLLVSIQFIKGYEPFLVILPLVVCRLFWDAIKKNGVIFDLRFWIYSGFCIYSGYFLIFVRFANMQSLHYGQTWELFHAIQGPLLYSLVLMTSLCVGFVVLSIGAKLIWLRFFLLMTTFATIGSMLWFMKEFPVGASFHVNMFIRFQKVALFFVFTCVCIFLSHSFLKASRNRLLAWCIFAGIVLVIHDLRFTYEYDRMRKDQMIETFRAPNGCSKSEFRDSFKAARSILDQNSFNPKKVVVWCPALKKEDFCKIVPTKKNQRSIFCLESLGMLPGRIEYNGIVEATQ